MGNKKEKLDRKLAKAKEGLAKAKIEYDKFLGAEKDYAYFKARVEKLTMLLTKL